MTFQPLLLPASGRFLVASTCHHSEQTNTNLYSLLEGKYCFIYNFICEPKLAIFLLIHSFQWHMWVNNFPIYITVTACKRSGILYSAAYMTRKQ